MLTNIYIENIAVIEKASIDFDEAFNILTGETGAGKSIIIDSINAIMGQRMSRDLIRSGAKQAFISATFSDVSKAAGAKLAEFGFEDEDGDYILQRTMTAAGKNTCKINGRPAPLSVFREVSIYLINIYGQNEGYDFMTADSHIKYIDAVGDYPELLEDYRSKYEIYTDVRRRLSSMNDNIQDRERKIDLLKYQIEEIEVADLEVGELEELSSRRKILNNAEKIKSGVASSYSALVGEESDGVLTLLSTITDELSELSLLHPDLEPIADRLQSAYEEINDCHYELRSVYEELDFDPAEIDQVEERYELIRSLSRKYGSTIEEILSFCDNARAELDSLHEYDLNKEKLENEYNKAKASLAKSAEKLSKARRAAAADFCEAVMKEMRYLDMPNVIMTPSIETCAFTETGCDTLELLISANPGEDPKPISKIASGGELSRMMLAVKTIIAEKDEIDTLIFDEVDTGISGSAASKVGKKLRELSKSHQVICITHQAQIAALADVHLFISKNVMEGRTFTSVRHLDFDERKRELSRMIDGENPSELSLQHAEEMLKSR